MDVDPILLTPEDAAKALSIGRTTLYELLRPGPGGEPALRSVKVGKLRRVLIDDLHAYVSSLADN